MSGIPCSMVSCRHCGGRPAGLAALPARNTSNPQPFSSLMFFERRTESSVQPKRLRYLLLLALRLALLTLLALAFANPFVNRTSIYLGRKPLTVIAIDRSFSMRYSDRMARAKAKATSLLNSLPGSDLAQIIAVDSHVENLTEPTVERDTLRNAIASIQAGDLASSFAELVRTLRSMEQNNRVALDVHFISDMQQSSMPAAFADLQVGPHTSLSLSPVDTTKAPNWAVESVNAPGTRFRSEADACFGHCGRLANRRVHEESEPCARWESAWLRRSLRFLPRAARKWSSPVFRFPTERIAARSG